MWPTWGTAGLLKNSQGLSQITMDHSYVQDLVNFGQITKEEARVHPRRNIITRVLGYTPRWSATTTATTSPLGTTALACTDGLTGYMEDELLDEYWSTTARTVPRWPRS